jgi:uncharacterized protein (DUF433 family)
MDWRERISVDPQVCHGRACVRGTRVMVSVVLDNLASGATADVVARDYHLTADDVRAALQYAGELARESVVTLPNTITSPGTRWQSIL